MGGAAFKTGAQSVPHPISARQGGFWGRPSAVVPGWPCRPLWSLPPTCFEPAVRGEGGFCLLWLVPVFPEHRGPPDQELPLLLLKPWGHLQQERKVGVRARPSRARLHLPRPSRGPHALLKLDTLVGKTANAAFRAHLGHAGRHLRARPGRGVSASLPQSSLLGPICLPAHL